MQFSASLSQDGPRNKDTKVQDSFPMVPSTTSCVAGAHNPGQINQGQLFPPSDSGIQRSTSVCIRRPFMHNPTLEITRSTRSSFTQLRFHLKDVSKKLKYDKVYILDLSVGQDYNFPYLSKMHFCHNTWMFLSRENRVMT